MKNFNYIVKKLETWFMNEKVKKIIRITVAILAIALTVYTGITRILIMSFFPVSEF